MPSSSHYGRPVHLGVVQESVQWCSTVQKHCIRASKSLAFVVPTQMLFKHLWCIQGRHCSPCQPRPQLLVVRFQHPDHPITSWSVNGGVGGVDAGTTAPHTYYSSLFISISPSKLKSLSISTFSNRLQRLRWLFLRLFAISVFNS